MTDFLTGFSRALCRADHDQPPSRAWREVLPLLCEGYAGDHPYAAALWLADDDKASCFTLWLTYNSIDGTKTHQPHAISVAVSLTERDKLKQNISSVLKDWADERFLSNDNNLILIQLTDVSKDKTADTGRHVLGVISLIGSFEKNSSVASAEDLCTAVTLASSWLLLNREARITRALNQLRDARKKVSSTHELADAVTKILKIHGNATFQCAIFIPDGAVLKHIGSVDREITGSITRIPLDKHSRLYQFHYNETSNPEADTALLRFGCDGEMILGPAWLAGTTLAELTGHAQSSAQVSVVLVRVRYMAVTNHERHAAIATFVIGCMHDVDPRVRTVGGSFTQTHLRIIDYAQDYFRSSYALLTQREKMAEINRVRIKVADATDDVMNEATDNAHLSIFANLVCTAIPSVIDAMITEVSSGRRRYFRPNPTEVTPPDWYVRPPTNNQVFFLPEGEGRYLYRQDILAPNKDHRAYELTLKIASSKIWLVEKSLLDTIVAEINSIVNRHLNETKWTQQLGEVRHNLRSVINGLLGKTDKVVDGYRAVAKLDAETVYNRLIVRAGFHKAISDLRYAAHELRALTENIRTISGGGNQITLQITGIDLPEMIQECLSLFNGEIARRNIRIHFINEFPVNLRNITGDRGWLHIMLFNLFENAVKYSRRDNDVHVRLWIQGKYWRLSVANEGKFIPSDKIDDILKPYVRIPSERGEQEMPGTGLGLPSVKAILDAHQMPGLQPPNGKSLIISSIIDEALSRPDMTHARSVFIISIPRLITGVVNHE